jgi:hypothetical protein
MFYFRWERNAALLFVTKDAQASTFEESLLYAG